MSLAFGERFSHLTKRASKQSICLSIEDAALGITTQVFLAIGVQKEVAAGGG